VKKGLAIVLIAAAAALAGYAATHWPVRRRPAPVSAASTGTMSPETPVPAPATARVQDDPVEPINVAAPEFGGHIELVTSESDHEDRAAVHTIDRGRPEDSTWTSAAPSPQEIVIGFFERQPARISAVAINPNTHTSARWAKDVEAWTSMESPTSGFSKVASLRLEREDADQTMKFAPVEARFVKIRVVSQYLGDDYPVGLGKIRVFGVLASGVREAVAARPEPLPAAAALPAPLPADACEVETAAPAPPVHGASARVLVLSRKDAMYPPIGYAALDAAENPDTSLFGRLSFTRVAPGAASVALLDAAHNFDTVVLSQVCDIKTSVPDSFKQALLAWVGQGHKLMIHDSDQCDAEHLPDYSFLPFKFATSNPGRHGAESRKLTFVEENSLGRSVRGDPAFLDLDAWSKDKNELGDSNTVTAYDAHWCGDLVTRNMLNVNGFVETYAHYGRGLILYDGFDADQGANEHYRRLLTHELAQPFDPDGLQCTARLADFVLTTEPAQRNRFMAAGQTFRYPVTLLSNQGYKGTVHLTAAAVPPDTAIRVALENDAVDLVDTSSVELTVTTAGNAALTPRTIAVRGVDAGGQSNTLCLRLTERTTGGLRVATDFPHPARPTKNLEIILDLSGSMKLPLGKSTRIATARRVLRDVVAKLPDDFNVGLRVYGHRYGSKQKETCTDSELVWPIQKLDRQRLLSIVDAKQPRGETPLVYSVLQTAADLKTVGGGSVILITDGEESCQGDPIAAARELKASGVDVNLKILGFTLTGQHVRQELSQFAAATGGHYYGAEDGEALGRALLMAAVEKMTFVVLDSAGRAVGEGQTDSAAIELAPGEYTVIVRAATGELRADHVAVTARGDSVINVVIDGDRFGLRR
jgi:hypothetical protein